MHFFVSKNVKQGSGIKKERKKLLETHFLKVKLLKNHVFRTACNLQDAMKDVRAKVRAV